MQIRRTNAGLIGICLFAAACSPTRSLPEGESLYIGAKVDLGENEDLATGQLKKDVRETVGPKPNSRLLGIPLRLSIYQLFDNGKDKGIFPWIRDKLGEPPVLYHPDYPAKVEAGLEARLQNNGYFDGRASSEVFLEKRKARIRYELDLTRPYRIDSLWTDVQHSSLRNALDHISPSGKLAKGSLYSLAKLRKESEYLEEQLKLSGYYYFNKDFFLYQADTANGDRTVDIRLRLDPDVSEADLQKMIISEVRVYPDYEGRVPRKSEVDYLEGLEFHFQYRPRRFRMQPIADHILFRPGDIYRIDYHYNTLKRLVNLNSMSLVNVQYERISESDSLLAMQVYLSPKKPQNIRGSLGLAYKNTNYISPEFKLTYTNRNLFRGSENLRLSGFINMNFPTGVSDRNNYIKSGAELRYNIPDLKLPFASFANRKDLILASTNMNVNYEGEQLDFETNVLVPLFLAEDMYRMLEGEYEDLEGIGRLYDEIVDFKNLVEQNSNYKSRFGASSLTFEFGYTWQRVPWITNQLNPIGIGFQFGKFETNDLKKILTIGYLVNGVVNDGLDKDESLIPLLKLERMFYWYPSYTFLYDGRKKEARRNNYFYRGKASFTGNSILPDESIEILGRDKLESYYFRVENDARYYLHTPGKRHTLASRLSINAAFPLGNDLFLPFFELFSIAGPNSVRAYGIQELGPGSTMIEEDPTNLTLFAGRGDLLLEANLEYRYNLGQYFELAAFADAGNVWILKSDVEAARFDWDRFHRQLGFGLGIGFRLKVDPLVIRLDVAFPLTKPWLPEGQRWVANQTDFLYGGWRKENLQYNLAFGYPF